MPAHSDASMVSFARLGASLLVKLACERMGGKDHRSRETERISTIILIDLQCPRQYSYGIRRRGRGRMKETGPV